MQTALRKDCPQSCLIPVKPDLFQRLSQVLNDILRIFNADAETEKAVMKFLGIEILTLIVFS